MINRCYLEITNVCNLDCVFCPGHDREPRELTSSEFEQLTDKLEGRVKFLYFHLMGEPCMHSQLPDFVASARKKGFIPVITTNGTLLNTELLDSLPYKINISLHAFEGNDGDNPGRYMESVMDFSLKAADRGCIVVLRLWNRGGYDTKNDTILNIIEHYVPKPWQDNRNGFGLAGNLYLEYDSMFSWPDSHDSGQYGSDMFCYALRNQIGVLSDGTVVPCCLDHNGNMALGNLFVQSLEDILDSGRARRIFEGFSAHKAVENMCSTCGYAAVTKRHRMD